MTGCRCIFLVQIVREYPEEQGYEIHAMPPVFCKWFLPAHLISRREPYTLRYIRIKKGYRRPASPKAASWLSQNEIRLYSRIIGENRRIPSVHCEIWFSSSYRIIRYEPGYGPLFEIPPPFIDDRCPFEPGGAS
jgi:hypothetical protein